MISACLAWEPARLRLGLRGVRLGLRGISVSSASVAAFSRTAAACALSAASFTATYSTRSLLIGVMQLRRHSTVRHAEGKLA